MSKLTWDQTGQRYFELGCDRGVLYPMNVNAAADSARYATGVAWNGLTSVSESPDGADANDMWADNIKYASIRAVETFGGTIEAYTYPDEFAECDGSAEATDGVMLGQQARRPFGFSYRTKIGSDVDVYADNAYKLHLVYHATASPSERTHESVNDSPEGETLSWEFDTTPEVVTGYKPTAHITIDSRRADATKLATLESILYGSETAEPRLPLPDEVISTLKNA